MGTSFAIPTVRRRVRGAAAEDSEMSKTPSIQLLLYSSPLLSLPQESHLKVVLNAVPKCVGMGVIHFLGHVLFEVNGADLR